MPIVVFLNDPPSFSRRLRKALHVGEKIRCGMAQWYRCGSLVPFPKELEAAFAHRFRLVRLAPIGFFFPPISVEPRLLDKPGTLEMTERTVMPHIGNGRRAIRSLFDRSAKDLRSNIASHKDRDKMACLRSTSSINSPHDQDLFLVATAYIPSLRLAKQYNTIVRRTGSLKNTLLNKVQVRTSTLHCHMWMDLSVVVATPFLLSFMLFTTQRSKMSLMRRSRR